MVVTLRVNNSIFNPCQPIQPIAPVPGFSCPSRNPFEEPKKDEVKLVKVPEKDEFIKQLNKTNNEISFCSHQSILKSLFKAGKLPTVTHGLYGDVLTIENVSLEHIKPLSKGGKSVLSNFALASRNNNSRRSSTPLSEVLTWKMLDKYLEQFNFKTPEFDGYLYQKMIKRTCAEQGVKSPYADVDIEELSKKELRSLRNKMKKQNRKLDLYA